MKAARGTIGRSLDQPDPNVRFYLLHGPDEAQSGALGDRLVAALKASKQAIASASLKNDPALLADEAAAIDIFGGAKVLWLQPATEDALGSVEALLEASACESPVVAVAGRLNKGSKLLQLADAHPLALSHASYELDARDVERIVVDVAKGEGLRLDTGVSGRIAEACANDQRLIVQEMAKFALYLDASVASPKTLGHDELDSLGAESGGDFLGIADLALSGDISALGAELGKIDGGGKEAIPVVRSLQRRLMMLAPMRAKIDGGERIQAVMTSMGKSLFWKDKPLVERLLGQWDSTGLARLSERVGILERRLMRGDSPPPAEAMSEELIAIARQARRR